MYMFVDKESFTNTCIYCFHQYMYMYCFDQDSIPMSVHIISVHVATTRGFSLIPFKLHVQR